uniref:SRCR domain-containing protein n=1 Tax=Leptobrachium leishanense TaxID=445787 RepID=A0A8C5MRS6_9ANUR
MGCGPLTQTIHTLKEVGFGVQMVEKMMCSGAESKVSECKVSLWRPEACYMNVHAGLVCSTEGLSKVTLVGGHSVCSGQLKVHVNGSTSTVCTDEWSQMEEVVVCRHMGCGPVLELKEGKKMVTLSKPTVDIQRLSCNGNEPDLSHCTAILSKGYKCNTEAVDVLCSQTSKGHQDMAVMNGVINMALFIMECVITALFIMECVVMVQFFKGVHHYGVVFHGVCYYAAVFHGVRCYGAFFMACVVTVHFFMACVVMVRFFMAYVVTVRFFMACIVTVRFFMACVVTVQFFMEHVT